MENPEGIINSSQSEPERMSGVMKVAGVSTEQEDVVLQRIKKEIFDKQGLQESLKVAEVEKTQENLEVINGVLAHLSDFIKSYGGSPAPINSGHIHMVDLGKMISSDVEANIFSEAFFDPRTQSVSIILRRNQNKLHFARNLAHELIHFNSFQSVKFDSNTGEIQSRTTGLSMISRKGGGVGFAFTDINEGITIELENRFVEQRANSIEGLQSELKRKNELEVQLDEKYPGIKPLEGELYPFYSTIKDEEIRGVAIERLRFDRGTKKLWEIISKIKQKNPEKFASEEDVFRMIAKMYFKGEVIPFARLIEKTFGKGSFKELACLGDYFEIDKK